MSTRLDSTLTINQLLPFAEAYTGTQDQPDVVSVFLKTTASDIYIEDEQFINDLGHSPAHFLNALPRIQKAAKILFQEFKQGILLTENSEAWNALKNLSRGIIQLVPLLGNAALYIYDLARKHLSIHPKIKSALSNQENPIVGIAFDGKPIFTVPLSELDQNYREGTPEEKCGLAAFLWCSVKSRAFANRSQLTTRELAEEMHQLLLNRQFVGPTTTSSIN